VYSISTRAFTESTGSIVDNEDAYPAANLSPGWVDAWTPRTWAFCAKILSAPLVPGVETTPIPMMRWWMVPSLPFNGTPEHPAVNPRLRVRNVERSTRVRPRHRNERTKYRVGAMISPKANCTVVLLILTAGQGVDSFLTTCCRAGNGELGFTLFPRWQLPIDDSHNFNHLGMKKKFI